MLLARGKISEVKCAVSGSELNSVYQEFFNLDILPMRRVHFNIIKTHM